MSNSLLLLTVFYIFIFFLKSQTSHKYFTEKKNTKKMNEFYGTRRKHIKNHLMIYIYFIYYALRPVCVCVECLGDAFLSLTLTQRPMIVSEFCWLIQWVKKSRVMYTLYHSQEEQSECFCLRFQVQLTKNRP